MYTFPVIQSHLTQLTQTAKRREGQQVRLGPNFVLMEEDSWWCGRRGVEGRR